MIVMKIIFDCIILPGTYSIELPEPLGSQYEIANTAFEKYKNQIAQVDFETDKASHASDRRLVEAYLFPLNDLQHQINAWLDEQVIAFTGTCAYIEDYKAHSSLCGILPDHAPGGIIPFSEIEDSCYPLRDETCEALQETLAKCPPHWKTQIYGDDAPTTVCFGHSDDGPEIRIY